VLVSVVTFFGIFVAAYFLLRRHSPEWPPSGFPGAPPGLWSSTALLFASSLALVRATRLAHGSRLLAGGSRETRRWIAITLLLGVGFVAAQARIWWILFDSGLGDSGNAYGTAFYSLTLLHVLHVLGGLGYLVRVMHLAGGDRARWLGPLERGSVYWHFMGGIWIGLFAVLYFTA
jgi:heme/copper-type cytochrome/quinol oxidase subunit 3